MQVINKPERLEEVQCYKCNTVFKVHPMQCMNSPYITECEYYKKEYSLSPNGQGCIEDVTEPA